MSGGRRPGEQVLPQSSKKQRAELFSGPPSKLSAHTLSEGLIQITLLDLLELRFLSSTILSVRLSTSSPESVS